MFALLLTTLLLLLRSIYSAVHHDHLQCSFGGKEMRFIDVSFEDEDHGSIAKDVEAVFGRKTGVKIWFSPENEDHFTTNYFHAKVAPDSETNSELTFQQLFEHIRAAGSKDDVVRIFEGATQFAWLSFETVWRILLGSSWEKDYLAQSNWITLNFDLTPIEAMTADHKGWKYKNEFFFGSVTIGGQTVTRYWSAKTLERPCTYSSSVGALMYDPVSHCIIDPTGIGLADLCKGVLHIPPDCTDVAGYVEGGNSINACQEISVRSALKAAAHFTMCIDGLDIYTDRDRDFMKLMWAYLFDYLEESVYDPMAGFKDISQKLDDKLSEKYFNCVIEGAKRYRSPTYKKVLEQLSLRSFVPVKMRDRMARLVKKWEGQVRVDEVALWLVMLLVTLGVGIMAGGRLENFLRKRFRKKHKRIPGGPVVANPAEASSNSTSKKGSIRHIPRP